MTNETLRMQMLAGIITEGEYKAKLQENKTPSGNLNRVDKKKSLKVGDVTTFSSGKYKGKKVKIIKVLDNGKYELELVTEDKKSLNESMIGGIVGIEAINQIPPRAKADYELAFEHFLGERYETKFENREQDPHTMKEEEVEEGKEVEEPSLYEGEVNENVGSTIDKMLQTFEFSEKGNDEMIEFANYLLSPEGPKNIARSIKGKLKGEGGENYFTSKPEELDAFLSKL
jgi:hypothetical protein